MTAVELTDVRKEYGEDTVALEDVSLSIDAGEFVVLLGPSGAGKSTMLRVLNGLTPPTEGTVRVSGTDPRERSGETVGMVFQMHYLIESMSAYRNALTGALGRTGTLRSILTAYDTDTKRDALDALDTVGLLDEATQRAGSMSGGQKQRVGIARALVQEPELLLADEPVSSLDPKAARDVMEYLKRAADARNLTTVTSLHQVNIAREFGDRFVGVRDGEIIFDGDEDDLTMDVVDEIYYGGGDQDRDRGGSAGSAGTDGTGVEPAGDDAAPEPATEGGEPT
jgi:phosphonate transport system ATP-binding protein